MRQNENNNNDIKKTNTLLALAIVLFGLASRFVPHPINVTAIGAASLMAGAYLRPRWMSYLIPLCVLFISDLYFGLHTTMLGVYLAFMLSVFIGNRFLSQQQTGINLKSAIKWLLAGSASSCVFFIVSNFAVWMEGMLYPRTTEGLVNCFIAAIPFFKNQLAGDMTLSFFFFSTYSLIASSKIFSYSSK